MSRVGALVSIVALHFRCKLHTYSQGEITGVMSSFFMPGIICAYHIYWKTWTPFVWDRLQNQRTKQPTRPIHISGTFQTTNTTHYQYFPCNEHNPYAVAVLENVRLCTVKPRPSFVSVASTIEGILEAILALKQARKEGSIAKSYESTQQGCDELYADT